MSRQGFARALRAVRIAADQTQVVFADSHNVRRWHVAEAECGNPIPYRHLQALSAALGGSLDAHLSDIHGGPPARMPRRARPAHPRNGIAAEPVPPPTPLSALEARVTALETTLAAIRALLA
jgi:hypothetical protein